MFTVLSEFTTYKTNLIHVCYNILVANVVRANHLKYKVIQHDIENYQFN